MLATLVLYESYRLFNIMLVKISPCGAFDAGQEITIIFCVKFDQPIIIFLVAKIYDSLSTILFYKI